jgi:hypothetical protein
MYGGILQRALVCDDSRDHSRVDCVSLRVDQRKVHMLSRVLGQVEKSSRVSMSSSYQHTMSDTNTRS